MNLSRRVAADHAAVPHANSLLTSELRDSSPYLADEGWHHVARLMIEAANEIERLNGRIRELESRTL
jgi:hypothetical protein